MKIICHKKVVYQSFIQINPMFQLNARVSIGPCESGLACLGSSYIKNYVGPRSQCFFLSCADPTHTHVASFQLSWGLARYASSNDYLDVYINSHSLAMSKSQQISRNGVKTVATTSSLHYDYSSHQVPTRFLRPDSQQDIKRPREGPSLTDKTLEARQNILSLSPSLSNLPNQPQELGKAHLWQL